MFRNDKGQVQGLAIDVLEHIAKQENWTLTYRFDDWKNVLAALETGDIDILVGIAYSEERERKFDFTSETLVNNWGVILQAPHQNISSIEQLIDKRVALMTRSTHSTAFRNTMRSFGFSFIEVPLGSYEDTLAAIQRGEADAAVVNRVFSLLQKGKYQTKETGIIFNPVEVRYAGHKNAALGFLQAIDRHLGGAKLDEKSFYYRALNRWLGPTGQQDWLPGWLLWAAFTGLLILLIVLIHNVILKRAVKKRTAALMQSETQFRQLAENINEVFFLISPDWQTVHYISPAYEMVWGHSCESLYREPLSWQQHIHPDDRSRVETDIKNRIVSDSPGGAIPEYRIIRPDQSIRWIAVRVYPIYDEKGAVYRIAGIANDISEQKQLTDELSESRRMLQTVLDAIPTRVFWKDCESVFLGCNRQFAADAGMNSPAELIGKTDFDLNWAEQAERYRRDDREVTATGKAKLLYEEPQTTPDGSLIWIETSKIPLTDSKGNIIGVLGTYNDITARKLAEDALKESEKRFELAVNGSNDGLWDWPDVRSNNVWWSERLYEILGYTNQEIEPTFDFFEKILHPDDVIRVKSAIEDHLSQHRPYDIEFRCMNKQGEYRWYRSRGQALWDEAGQPLRMAGSMQDITDRHSAEKALRKSEALLAEAQRISNTGSWEMDMTSKTLSWSGEIFRIFEIDPQEYEISYETFLNLVHPEDRDFVKNTYEDSIEHRAPYNIVHRVLLNSGKIKYVREQCETFYDDTGTPVRSVGTVQDITEQRLAAEALARSKAEFEAIFNSIGDAIIYTDKERCIVMVNPAVISVFGYEPDELIGKKTEVLYADKTDYIRQGELQFNPVSALNSATYEMRYRRKDGTEFVGETLGTKVFDTNREVLGMLAIIRDVTERNRARQELEEHRHRLQDLVEERTQKYEIINRELEAFSYSVSHDLRAPLRAIDGFSDALHEEYENMLDETGKEYLQRVRNAAQRMSILIDELLKLSRVTRSELEWQKVNLSQLAQEVVQAHRDAESQRDIEIVVQSDMVVRGDIHLLGIVMDNLIDNAWKYTRNTRQARIEIGAREIDGVTTYFVMDNGAGFDMRFENKLFKPFQRLHAVEDFEGTGIGLATVQRIINRHQGRIWAESQPGKGACFYFQIG